MGRTELTGYGSREMSWTGLSTAFGLGFLYFIAAIPAGVAAGASAWLAGLVAGLGYVAGAGIVLLAGAPLREWLVRKLKIPVERDLSKLVWRMWERGGLFGLCLIAPVTIGPQATAVIALAVGERTLRILVAIAVGVAPWCVVFAVLTAFGVKLVS
jgi:Ca2+/H+ antiporter, TMEM165/GDT1 family